jgi:glycosyltransferase involved in cell wall biosynthesis
MYNEEEVAEEFYRRTTTALASLPNFEIIAVDDGSVDATWTTLTRLAEADPRLKLVRLSRNFGHQTAITAGIDLAQGDTVTVIDSDLQDPPELIPDMIEAWRQGADIVFAVRDTRAGETAFKKSTASAFYRLLGRLARVDMPLDAGDFRLMSRRATEGLAHMRERSRYIRGLVAWMGLNRAQITYSRDARHAGVTKYPLRKMIGLAADGLVSFSTVPLHMATVLGLISAGLAFLVGVYAIIMRIVGGHMVEGWASMMVAVLFVGGVQLITLGVLGEYIGRIHDEVRDRPLYLIGEVHGFPTPVQQHFAVSPLPTRFPCGEEPSRTEATRVAHSEVD